MDLVKGISSGFSCSCSVCRYPDRRCIDGMVPQFNGMWSMCEERKNWDNENTYRAQCEKSGLSSERVIYDFKDYKGEDYNIENLKILSDDYKTFLGRNFYVWGENSTQKTTMLKAYGRHILYNNRNYDFNNGLPLVRFVSMSHIQKLLREIDQIDCEDVDEKNWKLNEYKMCKVLILDESFDSKKMQASKNDYYHLQLIDSFLRERLSRSDKTTIFISNIKPENIDERFGESIGELVRRSCEEGLFEFTHKIKTEMKKFSIRGMKR